MVTNLLRGEGGLGRQSLSEGGFTLVEMMIATGLTAAVVGAAVMLATSVQNVYSYELNDAAVQQEARFALDWIARTIAPAGSNPYGITASACPAAGTTFAAIRLDPDGDGIDDDIRVQADVNPPNGLLLGLAVGTCDEEGEDVTIAHDPDDLVLTRRDMALDASPVAMTDGVFTQLRFTYLTAGRVVTTNADAIAFVQVDLTAQSQSRNPFTGEYTSFSYDTEIRVRSR